MNIIIDTLDSWYHWYIKPIKYWPSDIKRGIKNLIYYFPVIWKQRDFDHGYIEELILYKFRRQYAHYTSPECVEYVGMEKDIQALKICIDILERRNIDWYTSQWYDNPKRESPDDDIRKNHLLLTYSLETRDWKIFCNIMEKYFPRWWD